MRKKIEAIFFMFGLIFVLVLMSPVFFLLWVADKLYPMTGYRLHPEEHETDRENESSDSED